MGHVNHVEHVMNCNFECWDCFHDKVHPFKSTRFIKLDWMQEIFEQIELDPENPYSDDHCHLKPGCVLKTYGRNFFERMANEYDLIISDSCTCTAEKFGDNQIWKNYNGHEFKNELEKHGFKGTYWPMWGKGLQDMCDAIQNLKDEGHNTNRIAVLCAGNDIKYGEDYCREILKKH